MKKKNVSFPKFQHLVPEILTFKGGKMTTLGNFLETSAFSSTIGMTEESFRSSFENGMAY